MQSVTVLPLVAELLTGTDSLQKDQEMNMELPTMHETPELQVFRLFYGRPPTIQVKGYGTYPVGGVQGGRGRLPRGSYFQGQKQQQEPRR